MKSPSDPLAALRPLHSPPPIDWWPPAPGWWLLGALLLLLLGYLWWRGRRPHPRRVALAELRALEQQALDDTQLSIHLNRLLRRVALSCFPRDQVASLSGEAWLRFLDAQTRQGGFLEGPGAVLGTAPYAAHSELDRQALLRLVRRWIGQACKRRKLG